ncbi:hypothetical protein ISF_09992 [Cordyceps fumosorosea ARSEF 2679]|uniref:Uncharacterized protein n=1 Tax=Cordyceps fumosorosea (strain ARSEF 2679) TaxID=1081104 RepID=A0A166WVF8_CORFA|nr:hypothetical protein ISF_09992 [Cordyceps fumosorosea ARSEF 2679]OAA35144.1 hypothetical protein ISF_09992 [Cordyceps fumosorosea ARSEF 2679]
MAYSTDMEKAMALREEKQERRDASDDIPNAWQQAVNPGEGDSICNNISTKEMEKAVLHTETQPPAQTLGQHPSVFKTAEVVMIPKPNKRNLSDVSTWRPISPPYLPQQRTRTGGCKKEWHTPPSNTASIPARPEHVDIVVSLNYDMRKHL